MDKKKTDPAFQIMQEYLWQVLIINYDYYPVPYPKSNKSKIAYIKKLDSYLMSLKYPLFKGNAEYVSFMEAANRKSDDELGSDFIIGYCAVVTKITLYWKLAYQFYSLAKTECAKNVFDKQTIEEYKRMQVSMATTTDKEWYESQLPNINIMLCSFLTSIRETIYDIDYKRIIKLLASDNPIKELTQISRDEINAFFLRVIDILNMPFKTWLKNAYSYVKNLYENYKYFVRSPQLMTEINSSLAALEQAYQSFNGSNTTENFEIFINALLGFEEYLIKIKNPFYCLNEHLSALLGENSIKRFDPDNSLLNSMEYLVKNLESSFSPLERNTGFLLSQKYDQVKEDLFNKLRDASAPKAFRYTGKAPLIDEYDEFKKDPAQSKVPLNETIRFIDYIYSIKLVWLLTNFEYLGLIKDGNLTINDIKKMIKIINANDEELELENFDDIAGAIGWLGEYIKASLTYNINHSDSIYDCSPEEFLIDKNKMGNLFSLFKNTIIALRVGMPRLDLYINAINGFFEFYSKTRFDYTTGGKVIAYIIYKLFLDNIGDITNLLDEETKEKISIMNQGFIEHIPERVRMHLISIPWIIKPNGD